MANETKFYTITAITNLHAGSGDTNYGVIDKLIQRDALTAHPCIHSQSLKGSLREFFENQADADGDFMDRVFGKGNSSPNKVRKSNSKAEGKNGEYTFTQAQLLSIPIRSDVKPFYRATSLEILQDLANVLDLSNYKDDTLENALSIDSDLKLSDNEAIVSDGSTPYLENMGFKAVSKNNHGLNMTVLKKIMGDDFVIVSYKRFTELTNNLNLPVIARNCLENGQSTNLWYEQILPRQTRFYFVLTRPNEQLKSINNIFDSKLKSNLVQIGANASIGYGLANLKQYGDE
jgi:CRISPR-associated protein Cmr4